MISIDRTSPVALATQIEQRLRELIASPALPGGARLLSIRQLAQQLAVSPIPWCWLTTGWWRGGLLD